MKRFIQSMHWLLWLLLVWGCMTLHCISIKKKVCSQFMNNNERKKWGFNTDNTNIRQNGKITIHFINGAYSNIIKKNYKPISNFEKKKKLKIYGEGFSNTFHTDIKKNTKNYSETELPMFHRYIENFKTKKIIHPSIRLNNLDKKYMKCKESYNKLFSPLSETDLFTNFIYTGRQKKGITSPKYTLPKYVEKPNYHKTGVPTYIPYNNKTDNINNDSNKKKDEENNNYGYGHGYGHGYDYGYENIKEDKEIEFIEKNCKFARSLMDDVYYILREGITTNDIDIYILNKCINYGFYPSPLFYNKFPKSVCISINEILCHGIPDNNILFENDIVKVDISVFRNGYHADMCESFIVKKKGKQEIKRDKQYYDFIYLNDKLKTKYTKFIFKYHFDLTKNQVVRKGKSFTTRKFKYVAPNTKQQDIVTNINRGNSWGDETPLLGNENFLSEIENENERYKQFQYHNAKVEEKINEDTNDYISYIEQFNRTYDEQVIYNSEDKNYMYERLQNFLYNKGHKKEEKHFDFFERKINIDDYKKMMYEKNLELIKAAYECTMEAISICKHGVPFNKIATVIHNCIKKKNKNYYVIPNLCGHNIGKNFHEEPFINHVLNDDDRKMCENLVFTIEPIISEAPTDYIMWPDNWTLANKRYFFSAQFEHTIWIKKDGAEILTKKRKNSPPFQWEQS